jgi:hypothetical protein
MDESAEQAVHEPLTKDEQIAGENALKNWALKKAGFIYRMASRIFRGQKYVPGDKSVSVDVGVGLEKYTVEPERFAQLQQAHEGDQQALADAVRAEGTPAVVTKRELKAHDRQAARAMLRQPPQLQAA